MIHLKEAFKILNKIPVFPREEAIPLEEAAGRILAEDVVSPIDMPPFHKSAMDGYAVSSTDDSKCFQVKEVIPAGYVPKKTVGPGQCAKIMTGGMLPEGTDRVIRREVTVEEEGVMRLAGEDIEQNVCFKGEDIKAGDRVLEQGIILRPQEVAVAASVGKEKLKVYKKPLVGIAATGSEIVKPGLSLKKGQIYDSNTYSLGAQLKQLGVHPEKTIRIADSPGDIKTTIANLLETCDLVLISGGVSMGDYDYVPGILEELGVRLHFKKVAIKPGKPTVFGSKDKILVFGVPGNPVSTFVIFEIFIKPFIYRMMGHEFKPLIIQGKLKRELRREKSTRTAFYPVCFSGGEVEFPSYHGSAHILALTQANGLIQMTAGQEFIPEGALVDVRPV